MRRAWVGWSCGLVLAGMTAGCVTDGGSTADALGAGPAVGSPVSAPAPVSMGSFLEGPVGLRLDERDRDAAFKAESQAVATGERRTWRGAKGVYGYVEPVVSGPAAAAADPGGGECRAFTHTVYFGGRPQVGRGSGCRNPDGTWRIS